MSGEQFSRYRRHHQYFLRGGDVRFIVENTLFQVHKFFFERESQFFAKMFSAPPDSAKADAYIIKKVKADDFAQLLWVFYNPRYSLYEATVDEWLVILDLAKSWGFQEIETLVIRELEEQSMDPVDKIAMYDKYGVDRRYVVPAYAHLASRPKYLSREEGNKLGLRVVIDVNHIREDALRSAASSGGSSGITPTSADLEQSMLFDLVERHLGLPSGCGTPSPKTPGLKLKGGLLPVPKNVKSPSETTEAKEVSGVQQDGEHVRRRHTQDEQQNQDPAKTTTTTTTPATTPAPPPPPKATKSSPGPAQDEAAKTDVKPDVGRGNQKQKQKSVPKIRTS
ncbi:hypothetical protein CONPUDRAFT_82586 [Coniophora puteana RWD-64-598 SS2]|uniref:BTB domain-containing protein n=1 Tax=Coniophora puteana (strain RWD-64-598) TaxID=741705 RepID=A0A5M3MNC3_CONPW|nr:uncharacterized protein CONPUDRAFT_82586 [Coniophora puteana RWD-64-598 SS2]EIW80274.1 hypothetical protein CONPUDRAFT_82586 [Coniophora puteana RWD-64-598 SS2]